MSFLYTHLVLNRFLLNTFSLCLDSENEFRLFLLTSLSSWFTRTVEYMI